jgi:hypothetical protein
MTNITIPRWLIHKVSYPQGYRLPKRTLLKNVAPADFVTYPKEDNYLGHNYNTRTHENIKYISVRHRVALTDKVFGFNNMEYRFWCAETSDIHAISAICRNCACAVFAPEKRQKHLEAEGCAIDLVKAYSLLLRDMKCIVCDRQTKSKKWGIPICDEKDCLDEFMHEIPTGQALHNALLLT